ncbi:uncharacterized protein EAE98_010135 [Botrytis deweyae]|uniref:Mid2 domain-containing protein n=1 Tax=Botrytis deweyae TaxID=2478750 RepID=A0ABQ7I9T2_9HELO|nr:uncharacterized protein EAE98_010135 [Botrytis deweyae]KAF7917719.1 hypothetical protein EAE98_010135 [Botrytis deweyae]
MAPMTRQTRTVPHTTIFPGVSKEITQTMTRRGISSAATILLDSSAASKFKDQLSTTRSVTIPVAVINPRSTTPQVNVAETMDLSSGAIVGIVLGSILGFLVLLVFGYKCCVDRRSAGWNARYDGDGDEIMYGERRDNGEGRGRNLKSGARGGGREEWEMRCEYDDGDGGGVRRIDKAVVGANRLRTQGEEVYGEE